MEQSGQIRQAPSGCDSATTLNQEKASLQLEACPKKDDVARLVIISLGATPRTQITPKRSKPAKPELNDPLFRGREPD
jgi:hypothetical protein